MRFSLQRWEQLVVSKLKWELSAVTPGDFLMHILTRLQNRLQMQSSSWDIEMVRRHAQTFIALSTRGERTRVLNRGRREVRGKARNWDYRSDEELGLLLALITRTMRNP
jgi:hypothetical protein